MRFRSTSPVALAALLLVAACSRPAPAPAPAPAPLTAELTAQFARAAEAWNRGDLEAFLADYAQDSTVAFVDGRRPQYGIAWIRAHYAPGFRPGAERGRLHFEELTVRPVTAAVAIVTARWILAYEGRPPVSGPFTVVMTRTPAGWRIIHDHSSADPR